MAGRATRRADPLSLDRGGARRRASFLLLLLLSACATSACGTSATQVAGGSALADTFESPEALAAAVLDAFARSDAARLQALALSEHEFRTVIWPGLPSSRPEVNLPVEYAWGSLAQNSRGALAAALKAHGGRRYALARIAFHGASTTYDTFTVRRESRLIVRLPGGEERSLALFGAMIEQAGRCKVFSYVTD